MLTAFQRIVGLILLAMVLAPQAIAHTGGGSTLSQVRQRGHIVCGTAKDEIGFSEFRRGIGWSGLFVDLCRAVAVAVLGEKRSVRFRPLTGSERFNAVAERQVDVLTRATAWTLSGEASANVRFVGPFFYDGKGFLIRKNSGLSSALELSGAHVCVMAGSLTEAHIQRFFERRDMGFTKVTAGTWTDLIAHYRDGRCVVLAADVAQLAIQRRSMQRPDEHVLLPETVSHDVFGPVVAASGDRWFKIVRWVMFALIHAERIGLTSTNVTTTQVLQRAEVRSFVETANVASEQLGLSEHWLSRMIRQVGNYGEIFERCLGKMSGIRLPRGRNALAQDGGLLAAPSFR
ncbi:MAG: amino acid ABC transporter substrate-binding protein [Hyphomicrobiaceae bacterium]